MKSIVLDLEWNGAYCHRVGGYFNEIIEIGAVRLSETLEIEERFDALIRPTVSRKLTKLVTELTGFTDGDLGGGVTFAEAMKQFARFAGDGEVAVLTWSTTDLLVFLENCRFFFGRERIPVMTHYLDLQAYAQTRMGHGTAQQIALGRFADLLGMDSAAMELHHAIDDSVLSAEILRRVYEADSFSAALRPTDAAFYDRLTFKPYYLHDIRDPQIRPSDREFSCEVCGRKLKRTGEWKTVHRCFTARFRCDGCDRDYLARLQARRKYDGVEIKRKCQYLPPKEETADGDTPAAADREC